MAVASDTANRYIAEIGALAAALAICNCYPSARCPSLSHETDTVSLPTSGATECISLFRHYFSDKVIKTSRISGTCFDEHDKEIEYSFCVPARWDCTDGACGKLTCTIKNENALVVLISMLSFQKELRKAPCTDCKLPQTDVQNNQAVFTFPKGSFFLNITVTAGSRHGGQDYLRLIREVCYMSASFRARQP
jgi:hypothetical protein